ncbi:lipopolysaccharide assembly protein LapB [Methylophilus sp. 5]|uniref:tetratricopeptide repeat protein n=1 Tax=Methylophilus sp. 5 TaxID=1112274 RepID=UPI00049051EB|nr:tetratricopeptide repeat protein [Methylophilus sp. 5]
MSLINQVLQNVEARQGAAATDGWAGQVKPVLSHQGSAAAWGSKLRWALLLLIVIGCLLVNWPMFMARFAPAPVRTHAAVLVATATPVVPAPAITAVASLPVEHAPVALNNAAWAPPQLTKALFSPWQKPATDTALAAPMVAKPASTKIALRPQVEGEFTINPADSAAANLVVTAIEPSSGAGNTPKLAKNNDDESGPRGVVNKQIRPDQEVNLQIQRAVDQEQKGRLNEALAILRQALVSYPQSEDARQLLAAYLFESRQEAEAVAVLQSGIKQFPGQIGLSKSLAKWQLAHGQPDAVLQTLKPVANLLIQDAESQWMLAMAYQQSGQHAAALPHFERATILRPGHAQWIVAYAISLQAAGQPAPALQQLQLAYNLPLSERLSEFVGQRIRQLGGTAVVRSE